MTAPLRPGPPVLGLRENAAQFILLVAVNALVGGMLGQERTVVPLLAEREFGIGSHTAGLTFIVAFGLAKAAANYAAGTWSDRYGRRPVLLAGWLLALPVPLVLAVAQDWAWVVAANVLLGISQGLTWSTTVVMKIDLVGPQRRGLAMGLNEAAGYGAVAAAALATGWIAEEHGLRPAPFLLGLAVAAVGLGVSAALVRETRGHAEHEATLRGPAVELTDAEVFRRTSLTDRNLSAVSQAGLVNNLNDGLAWGLFPVLFAAAGLSVGTVGLLAALYPASWGLGQLVTGALSDRVGRKPLITGGMFLQGAALAVVAGASGTGTWAAAMLLLGLGTAMVYPTLLAAIGDVAAPAWRARAVGVYRLWRDAGFAVGALVAGVTADLVGVRPAVAVVAAVTVLSGAVVAGRMGETLGREAGLGA